jgi:hypothetical protein
MTQEDLDFIKNYQRWRRDDEGTLPMPSPTEIGIALDKLIAYCEMCIKLNEDAENRR